MMKLKNKLNIKRITAKNLLLLVLLAAVLAVVGVISKLSGAKVVNVVEAQCWTSSLSPSGEGCTATDGDGGGCGDGGCGGGGCGDGGW